jgi:hypothetical protein
MMVALVFGQSNAANHGETRYASRHRVYNFFDGKCYEASDPLLGAEGHKGSVWTRLGDKLIDANLYDSVLFVSIAVGGTSVKRWSVHGDMHHRIGDAIDALDKRGFKITHLFWHQGETDTSYHTGKDEYKKRFMVMLNGIRKSGVDAPIYVAEATICRRFGPDPVIEQAQRELVNPALKIFPGPDTDELNTPEDRYDGCHLSTTGLDKHADMWLKAIVDSE